MGAFLLDIRRGCVAQSLLTVQGEVLVIPRSGSMSVTGVSINYSCAGVMVRSHGYVYLLKEWRPLQETPICWSKDRAKDDDDDDDDDGVCGVRHRLRRHRS